MKAYAMRMDESPGVAPLAAAGSELTAAVRAELLDTALWHEVLERYARTTHLAVALTDQEGRILGPCHHPQPLWSAAHAAYAAPEGQCPFCLVPVSPCTAVMQALKSQGVVLSRDRAGLAHVTVPLTLGDHALGALIAGQVFDQYPEQLSVERVARELGVSPQKLWQLARQQQPVSRKNLQVYGDLLLTFGQTFLQARYGVILERARAAEMGQLLQMERQARALVDADRRKNEFLAMLAHELRNPLSAINNAVHLAHVSANEQQAERARAIIGRQVQQLRHLIDDLLDVSRIEQGKIELRKETLDATAILESAVAAVRPVIEEREHDLRVALPPEPLLLQADPTRLEQILVNLLTNAAKYTEPGGAITLTAERAETELVIRVQDTGIGIPTEMLPHVFELFTQVEGARDRSQGGLGIGLALVRKLVEMHEGTISVQSEGRGKGSEFLVRLPVVAPFVLVQPEAMGTPA